MTTKPTTNLFSEARQDPIDLPTPGRVLTVGAHPDDVEMAMGGTVAALVAAAWWPVATFWQSDDWIALHYAADLGRAVSDFFELSCQPLRLEITTGRVTLRGMAALAYSPSADRRSWQHMTFFFDELFPRS